MIPFISRAGRAPLALAIAMGLGACADEPTAPNAQRAPVLPSARTIVAAGDSTIIVTNTSGGTEPGSLRWATQQLPPSGGTIRFHSSLAGATITLNERMDIPYSALIEGPMDKGITISGGQRAGIVSAHKALGFRNVTLTKGFPTPIPPAPAYISPIVAWAGPLYFENSTVSDVVGGSSAILSMGNFYLVNSTLTNLAANPALEFQRTAVAFITNSTITHVSGSILYALLEPSDPPMIFVKNSILTSNYPVCPEGSGRLASFDGMNILGDPSCGTSSHAVVADPLVLSLADNGGPTKTRALDHRSPAVNGGANCSVAVDQRWVTRDSRCDIGAVEFTDFTRVTITVSPNANIDPATGAGVVTGTVACTRDEPELGLAVQVTQEQKIDRMTTIVRGDGGTGVAGGCTTTPKAWSASVTPSNGSFRMGPATVTASINDIPIWMRPASVTQTVKFPRQR